MKVLEWYSVIILALALINVIIMGLTGNADVTQYWGAVILTPILIYFILILIKRSKNGVQ
jgi:hypothetical protein